VKVKLYSESSLRVSHCAGLGLGVKGELSWLDMFDDGTVFLEKQL
jgi:hypothetical protein